METWPAMLPTPAQDLSIALDTNHIRTRMESGLTRQRRRYTADAATISVVWEMSDLEFGLFSIFHRNYLNLGADWFTIPLPMNGNSLTPHVARFVSGNYRQQYQE